MTFLFIFSPYVSFTVHNNDRRRLRFYVPCTVFKLVPNNNRPVFVLKTCHGPCRCREERQLIVYNEHGGGDGGYEALSSPYYTGHSRVLVVLSLFLTDAFREQKPEEKTGKVSQSLCRRTVGPVDPSAYDKIRLCPFRLYCNTYVRMCFSS